MLTVTGTTAITAVAMPVSIKTSVVRSDINIRDETTTLTRFIIRHPHKGIQTDVTSEQAA